MRWGAVSRWRAVRWMSRWRLRRARPAVPLLLGPIFSQGSDKCTTHCPEEAMARLMANITTSCASPEGTKKTTFAFPWRWTLRIWRWLPTSESASTRYDWAILLTLHRQEDRSVADVGCNSHSTSRLGNRRQYSHAVGRPLWKDTQIWTSSEIKEYQNCGSDMHR